jgi:hypothetical protein
VVSLEIDRGAREARDGVGMEARLASLVRALLLTGDEVSVMRPIVPAMVACLSASTCAPPPTTAVLPPNHQSVAAEEAVARRQEHAAGVLELQGGIADDAPQCGPVSLGQVATTCGPPTRETGETTEDSLRAAQLREEAAGHRRVATMLASAEARACNGLSDVEIAVSPFGHRGDIVDVQVVSRADADGRPRVAGARVRFHQLEQLSADRLQHLLDCHIAIDSALGNDVPEKSYSPLVPRGARATVTTVPHGYVVEVLSDDPDGAREIARRAQALRPGAR